MQNRKLLTCGITGVLLAGLLVTPVSAHGHHSQIKDTAKASKICSLCTEKDCTETGYHLHDDEVYCGFDHEQGYCDGSCGNSCEKQSKCETSTTKRSRRHHNGHHH